MTDEKAAEARDSWRRERHRQPELVPPRWRIVCRHRGATVATSDLERVPRESETVVWDWLRRPNGSPRRHGAGATCRACDRSLAPDPLHPSHWRPVVDEDEP